LSIGLYKILILEDKACSGLMIKNKTWTAWLSIYCNFKR